MVYLQKNCGLHQPLLEESEVNKMAKTAGMGEVKNNKNHLTTFLKDALSK